MTRNQHSIPHTNYPWACNECTDTSQVMTIKEEMIQIGTFSIIKWLVFNYTEVTCHTGDCCYKRDISTNFRAERFYCEGFPARRFFSSHL